MEQVVYEQAVSEDTSEELTGADLLYSKHDLQ